MGIFNIKSAVLGLLIGTTVITSIEFTEKVYATSNIEQSETNYSNSQLGIKVKFPESWSKLYGIKENKEDYDERGGRGIEVYQKATRDKVNDNGTLFFIERWKGKYGYENLPIKAGASKILAVTSGYTYILRLPSDFQGDEKDEEIKAEYIKLSEEISKVQINIDEAVNLSDLSYNRKGIVVGDELTDNYSYEFSGGKKDLEENDVLLLANGKFVIDGEVIIRNNRCFVETKMVDKIFNLKFEFDKEKYIVKVKSDTLKLDFYLRENMTYVNDKKENIDSPFIIEKGNVYIQLRYLSEKFGGVVGYLPSAPKSKTVGFYNVSEKQMGIAYNPVVWLDSKEYEIEKKGEKEEVLLWLKSSMMKGFTELSEKEQNSKTELKIIEEQIENMKYVGKVGRFLMFKGPFVTVVDYASNDIYFYRYGHAFVNLEKVGVEDYNCYKPMYFND